MSPQTQMKGLLEIEEEREVPTGGGSGGGRPPKKQSTSSKSLRERVETSLSGALGRFFLVMIVVAGLGFGAWSVIGFVEEGNPSYPKNRIMNPDTGELRWHRSAPGRKLPEGFHYVEYCFNNECGPAGGTPVVLNIYLDIDEPTECPRCGAPVVGHNPRPEEYKGVTPADQRD